LETSSVPGIRGNGDERKNGGHWIAAAGTRGLRSDVLVGNSRKKPFFLKDKGTRGGENGKEAPGQVKKGKQRPLRKSALVKGREPLRAKKEGERAPKKKMPVYEGRGVKSTPETSFI